VPGTTDGVLRSRSVGRAVGRPEGISLSHVGTALSNSEAFVLLPDGMLDVTLLIVMPYEGQGRTVATSLWFCNT
jgi:hypothetical protein